MPLDTLEKGINVKNLSLDVPAKQTHENFGTELGIKDEHYELLRNKLERIYSNAQMDPEASWLKITWILPGFKILAPEQMDVESYVKRINWDQTFAALQKRPNGSDWYGFVITASNIALLKPKDPKLAEMAAKYKPECLNNFEFLKENNVDSQVGNVARGLWILYPDLRSQLEEDKTLFNLTKQTVDESEATASWENCVRNAATLKIIHPKMPRSDLLSNSAFQQSSNKFRSDLDFIKFWRDDQSFIPFSQLGASLKILSSETVKIGSNGFEFTTNNPKLDTSSPLPKARNF